MTKLARILLNFLATIFFVSNKELFIRKNGLKLLKFVLLIYSYTPFKKNNILKNFNEKDFEKYLSTSNIPDPELLIRTSGEQRISNFYLWQTAYTELYFTDILWPDFNKKELNNAIFEFNKRNRRFGKV